MCVNQPKTRADRRGVVLMVVLVLLALFSVVGILFVFYSQQEAETAKVQKDAAELYRPDPDLLLAYLLNQLIIGTNDPNSALVGHSMLQGMYGQPGNSLAYNGPGKLHRVDDDPMLAQVFGDYYYYLNYSAILEPNPMAPSRLRLLSRPDLFGSFNPPYTYPDHNTPWLGAVLSDGTVVARTWVRVGSGGFNPYDVTSMDPMANWWLDQDPAFQALPPAQQAEERLRRRAMTMRPRPTDHAGFPPPEDFGGDVKCLPPGTKVLLPNGAPWTGNDSFWFDPNFPVQLGPDGKRYKPLFAMFVMELDSKFNVNVHGNLLGDPMAPSRHASGPGLGPWEVAPPSLIAPQDFNQLLQGRVVGAAPWGRYANSRNPAERPLPGNGGDPMAMPPTPPETAPPFALAGPFYAPVDTNGMNDSSPPQRIDQVHISRLILPGRSSGTLQASSWSAFPLYPPGYDNGSPTARLAHPVLYNYFNPTNDRRFTTAHLEMLHRIGDTGTDAHHSDLARLLSNSLTGPQGNRLRWMLTTDSVDRAGYGLTPWFRPGEPMEPHKYLLRMIEDPMTPGRYVVGGPSIELPAMPADGEFQPSTYRARPVAALSGRRLNLANSLFTSAPYPTPVVASGRIDLSDPAILGQFQSAQSRRQAQATQFYRLLVQATGAYDASAYMVTMMGSTIPPPTTEEFNALRWLAQLAVNMVDYLDPDDYITPFNWGTVVSMDFAAIQTDALAMPPKTIADEWVYGTELPRLVINESYVQYEVDPNDNTKVRGNVWAELHNPLNNDAALIDGGAARLQIAAQGMLPKYSAYKFTIAKPDPMWLRDPRNVLGDPNAPGGPNTIHQRPMMGGDAEIGGTPPTMMGAPPIADFTDPDPMNQPNTEVVRPSNNMNYNGGAATPEMAPNDPAYTVYREAPDRGWYLLGPTGDLPKGPAYDPANDPKIPKATLQSAAMTFEDTVAAGEKPKVTLLLRRLLVPHIPPDPRPMIPDPMNPMGPMIRNPLYNPYITVDYMEMDEDWLKPYTPMMTDPATLFSWGRNQPYAAHHSNVREQKPGPALANQVQHTFFRHNSLEAAPDPAAMPPLPNPNAAGQTLKLPFDWLVHLDRPLTNPLELLHVSAFKPHELTQQFMDDLDGDETLQPSERFLHLAPWFDPAARLYRFLEFFECTLQEGQSPNHRAGKMNLNMMFDEELFFGMADLPPAFQNQLQAIFANFKAQRDGAFPLLGLPNHRPLWSLSVGPQAPVMLGNQPSQFPNGTTGISETWLREAAPNNPSATGPRLFELLEPDGMGGFRQSDHPYERHRLLSKLSNNLTTRSNVFAVWITVGYFEVDNQGKLMQEIGRADGRNKRHRMFAVVDRSVFDQWTGPDPRLDPRRADPSPVLYWSIIE